MYLKIKNKFYKKDEVEIKKSNIIKNSLIVKDYYYLSLLNTNYKHIYYILNSYCNENGLINSIYFVLTNLEDKSKPQYLHRILISDIIKIKSDEFFLDWWEKMIKKLSFYETEEEKISILINLNITNISQKFNIQTNECFFLQPDLYNKNNFFIEKINLDFKSKLKYFNYSLFLNLFFFITILYLLYLNN